MILEPEQSIALDYLEDQKTNELLFGGGAGGGKSVLGCYWISKNCLKYPGTRWLIGRAKLKTLKETTLKTFFEVMQMQGIDSAWYNYNSQTNQIKWRNGSEIFLKDLFFYPADPEFDELGSLEISGAFIDEASQIVNKAKQIVKSRMRYKLTENNIFPTLLMTTNPTRGFIYEEFYKPFIDGRLPRNKQFVRSLAENNPHLSEHYINILDDLDDTSRKRLKLGDWDYIDDPSLLVDYDAVDDLFTNDHIKREGIKHLGADIAMKGRDKFVVIVEQGGVCDIKASQDKSTGKGIEIILRDLMTKNGIGRTNSVVDSDGVGAYLESYITNIKTFHGGAAPVGDDGKEYNNLKSQCGFKLAEVIMKRELYIVCGLKEKLLIKRELLNCLKRDRIDIDDNKKRLISKEKMKQLLGHSPDFMDVLLMLMVYRLSGGRARTKAV